jgi:hypothetical protein
VTSSEDRTKAAWLAMRAGEHPPAEYLAACKAESDLIERTWHTGREMTRDEKRCLALYAKTKDSDDLVARYCTKD